MKGVSAVRAVDLSASEGAPDLPAAGGAQARPIQPIVVLPPIGPSIDDVCACLVTGPHQTPNKVGEVMRTEMKKLRSCFDKALGLLGGLEALAEANSVAAAEAIDKEISK